MTEEFRVVTDGKRFRVQCRDNVQSSWRYYPAGTSQIIFEDEGCAVDYAQHQQKLRAEEIERRLSWDNPKFVTMI